MAMGLFAASTSTTRATVSPLAGVISPPFTVSSVQAEVVMAVP